MDIGPLQHGDVNIGDPVPVRCLKNGLWLSKDHSLPFAVLFVTFDEVRHGRWVHIEIAVSKGEQGAQFSQEFFRDLEVRVGAGRTYRGRVIFTGEPARLTWVGRCCKSSSAACGQA